MLNDVQTQTYDDARLDQSRNGLLTEPGFLVLEDHLFPGENCQDLFARVARSYADDAAHFQRIHGYMSRLWFMPSLPMLSACGRHGGLPVEPILKGTLDDLGDVASLLDQLAGLAAHEGRIERHSDNLRAVVPKGGGPAAALHSLRVMDSLRQALTDGPLQRGSSAAYLPISHPEIEEFVELRWTPESPVHQGILVPDAFMEAVDAGGEWRLTPTVNGGMVRAVSAPALWARILLARLETGGPDLVFSDHVAKGRPEHQTLAGLQMRASSLDTASTLPTGVDQHGRQRQPVSCLAALNLECWLDWRDHPLIVEDAMRFLDNALQDFIDRAPPSLERARYSAARERSVGLGVVGFHSFLQSQSVPFESMAAKVWNKSIFKQIRTQSDQASLMLAEERGACLDALEYGAAERFSCKLALGPNTDASVIAGGVSTGISPVSANVATHRAASGPFMSPNRHLQRLLASRARDTDAVWSSIAARNGSVQHLAFLSSHERAVFRTSSELDQCWVIEHAADRTPFVCQSQSVDLFPTCRDEVGALHRLAWKRGLKSLRRCQIAATSPATGLSET